MELERNIPAFLTRPELAQNSPELTRLIAEKDWSKTPLGPISSWSPALQRATEDVLGSGYGLLLWWGPQHIQIYNDAYRPVLGTKHPYGLGMPGAECWSEIWDTLAPMVERPYHGGLPSVTNDLQLLIERNGFPEETHFSLAYSPVFDDTAPNGIGGVLAIVRETTEQVISSRRMELLRDIGASTSRATTLREAARLAAGTLSRYPADIAFTRIYALDHDRGRAHLVGQFGETTLQPTSTIREINRYLELDTAELSTASRARGVIAVPLATGANGKPAALLLASPSSGHAFDATYLDFFNLIAAPISSAILNALAYEFQRERVKALEELDSAKNVFFSNISHEFRTPLTLMLGPLAELSRSEEATTRDLADKARRNSLRLLKLVNTLLEFSRLQAGRNDAAFVKTDLARLTRHLIGVFGSAFESAGLEIHTDISLHTPVYVDRSMWERIVLNLISNAIKFTLAGAITVSLQADGDVAELIVSDTGIGIPASELPHIFERFRRVRNSISRSHEGSGIGLALVKELVELHSGTIEARNNEGQGTSFIVRIPLGREHLDAERIISDDDASGYASSVEQYIAEVAATMNLETTPAPDDTTLAPNAKRILLVDDNTDLLDYLTGILSKRYHVTCARNGVEAFELLREQHFDVVVSDVMMPLMDGFELLHAIRSDERLRAMPFIMLSARADSASSVHGLTSGADDYLTKPFNADDLIARIYAQIHGTALRQEAMDQLRASEDRFRTLALSLPNIVMEAKPDGDVTFLSDAFSRYTGLPVEAGLGSQWMHTIHPDDTAATVSKWNSHTISGEPCEHEFRLRRFDGVYRWHHCSALPLRNSNGDIVRWTGTITDIHDRRLALEERELLGEASQLFLQSFDVSTTLGALARLVVPRLADWCQIDLRTGDGAIKTVAIAHRDPDKNRLAQQLLGRVHLNPDASRGTPRTIRTGALELVPHVTPEMLEEAIPDPEERQLYRTLGITSGISLPLVNDGAVVGAFTCAIDSTDRTYNEDDLGIVQELVRRSAVALQKAEAFEREHRVAGSFQEASLPPSLPRVPGVRFDAVYVAGRSEAQVGGDWYDAVRLLDGRLVISIGDVAGSGLNAAVRMGNMRQIIRGIAQVHADPVLMLDAADRALRLEHPEQFVTAFVGVVDSVTKTLTYASAGHPPALLRRPNGDVEQLSDGGLPLGLRYYHGTKMSTSVSIEDGSLLLLYTDGLTEMEHDVVRGEERLMRLVASDAIVEQREPAAFVRRACLDGAAPHDDVAILAVTFEHVTAHASEQIRHHWSFSVDDRTAAHAARREFSKVLAVQGVSDEDLHAAELVFGELVGNVVRYAPGSVDITLECTASPPVLHVVDSGPGFRHMAILPADLYSERGRGLYIVSALTQDFHVTRRPAGGSHARAVLSLNSRRNGEAAGSLFQSLMR